MKDVDRRFKPNGVNGSIGIAFMSLHQFENATPLPFPGFGLLLLLRWSDVRLERTLTLSVRSVISVRSWKTRSLNVDLPPRIRAIANWNFPPFERQIKQHCRSNYVCGDLLAFQLSKECLDRFDSLLEIALAMRLFCFIQIDFRSIFCRRQRCL